MAATAMVCPSYCAMWALKYLGTCLCSTKDGVSLILGLVSVLSWGIAEVPQIITNYKTKSSEGLSFSFLFIWIIGDLFNLIGCMLEPATLPTQLYMAVLYTATTLTLTAQSLYYSYFYRSSRSEKERFEGVEPDHTEGPGDEYGKETKVVNGDARSTETIRSSPIALPALRRSSTESYYMSARSLTKSHTPTKKRIFMINDDNGIDQPLLSESLPVSTTPSRVRPMLCVASVATFSLGLLNTHWKKERKLNMVFDVPNQGIKRFRETQTLVHVGNQMLNLGQVGIGTYLGWGMAAIYMGARIPQIYLNIKRGHVEGLNPLMFIFALFGNTTYVASILVNSMEWTKIRPNIPWLVDAVGCVLLDTFILFQFIYYRHRAHKNLVDDEKDGYSAV